MSRHSKIGRLQICTAIKDDGSAEFKLQEEGEDYALSALLFALSYSYVQSHASVRRLFGLALGMATSFGSG